MRLSYAQARLRLGILGVGLWVCLSILALASGWAQRIALWEWMLLYVLMSLPLDLSGGQLLPHFWNRPRRALVRWAIGYLRAVALQLGVMAVGLTSILAIANLWGLYAALFVYSLLALLMLEKQEALSRLLGLPLHSVIEGESSYALAEAEDTRFSGGISGFPGRERVVLPTQWWQNLSSEAFLECLQRRLYLIRTGARNAGLLLAVFFNASLLYFAIPWSGGSAVTLSCWFTLGSFLGLLVLPSFSRPGVFSADAWMAQRRPREEVIAWIQQLDHLQEEDAQRPVWVERVFHPIPQFRQRVLLLAKSPRWRPWNAARYALLTSWLAGGLLARAVHCNSGQPELWLWPPGD